jgi:DNA-binding NarL/FixJ family response regulator
MYKIAVVESQAIVREGLRMLLSGDSKFTVSNAIDPIALFRQTWSTPPDLVIMDKVMPGMNGVEALHEIKKRWIDTKVLIFTSRNTQENIARAFHAGASGYLLRSADPDELLFAINQLLLGNFYVTPAILPTVLGSYINLEKSVIENINGIRLSTRERELLKLIAEGNKNKDIANILCISVKTVETHRYNLMRKLDAHNVADLVAFANRSGMMNDGVKNETIVNHPNGTRIVERREQARMQTPVTM